MFVVPVSFATITAMVLGFWLFLGIVCAFRGLVGGRSGYTPAEIRRRRGLPPPAPLTWGHKAFAWGVPLSVVAIIVAAHLS